MTYMTVTNYVLPWCYIIMFYVGDIILFMHHLATTEPFVTTGSKSRRRWIYRRCNDVRTSQCPNST